MSGGSGYVLSKEALRLFIEQALQDGKLCRPDHDGAEEVEIGKCMQNIAVFAGDSRDTNGRGIYCETDEGLDCCSNNAVSFHYVSPNQMYVFDYLIYHLRPYGIVNTPDVLPQKISKADYNAVDTTDAKTKL